MDEKQIIEQKLFQDTSRYADIIDTPYQGPKRHLPMTQEDRAGQFSPFAALTGFNGLIAKKAVIYQKKEYLSAQEESALRAKLTVGSSWIFDYFNDQTGYYEEQTGTIAKIVPERGRLWLTNQRSLVIANIRAVRN